MEDGGEKRKIATESRHGDDGDGDDDKEEEEK